MPNKGIVGQRFYWIFRSYQLADVRGERVAQGWNKFTSNAICNFPSRQSHRDQMQLSDHIRQRPNQNNYVANKSIPAHMPHHPAPSHFTKFRPHNANKHARFLICYLFALVPVCVCIIFPWNIVAAAVISKALRACRSARNGFVILCK